MSCVGRGCKTKVGCGYKVEINGNTARIIPTSNHSKCNIEFGIGNATFVIDPSNPPDTLKKEISSGRSDNFETLNYAPSIIEEQNVYRHHKSFSSIVDDSITITDDDGDTVIPIKRIIGYERKDNIDNIFSTKGYIDTALVGGGRLIGKARSSIRTVIPFVFSINTTQTEVICNSTVGSNSSKKLLAYLGLDGEVHITDMITGDISFDFGQDGGYDKEIVEFTIKTDLTSYIVFIVKNIDGYARKVYIDLGNDINYSINKIKYDPVVLENVAIVAGGEIFNSKLNSKGSVEYGLNEDNRYVPLLDNGYIDVSSDGQILLENEKKRIGSYILYKDGTLKKDGNVIDTDVTDFGLFSQESIGYLGSGKLGADDAMNRKVYKDFMSNFISNGGWFSEYDSFMDNIAPHPKCEWAGIGESNSSTSSLLPCITGIGQLGGVEGYDPNSFSKISMCYIKNGKIYDESGYEQFIGDWGSETFKEFYERSDRRMMFLDSTGNTQIEFFGENDTGVYSDLKITGVKL